MHNLYKLKERLVAELEEYGKKDLTMGSLDVVDKLAHAAKNVCKLMESSDNGYSKARGRDVSMDYVRPDGSYRHDDMEVSHRGRGRDSMGRYSREGVDEHTKEELMRLIEKM